MQTGQHIIENNIILFLFNIIKRCMNNLNNIIVKKS